MRHYFFFLLLAAIFVNNSYSQTNYVIDFSYETTLSTTSCNVFSGPNIKVDNYIHQTTKGFPTFTGADNYWVNLACKRNSSTSQTGTEYQVLFPFKQGYRYDINVYYKGTVSSGSELYPQLALGLNQTKKTQNTSTTCNGPQSTQQNEYLVFAASSSSLAWASSSIISTTVLSANYESLSVGAYPFPTSTATGTQSIQVRAIQITEYSPNASFTLSPSSSTISCGSVAPKTFTITNVNNTPGVTNYTWNLGANNGWLYNGNPAPQTISTGTTNTLTLTPDCGKVLSNISATVTVSGVNYQTSNTASTTLGAPPTLSISGSDNINIYCNPAVYSIPNLPCNATVVWSIQGVGLISLSCTNCIQTSITKLPLGSTLGGTATLTATITSCGVIQTVSKQIQIANTTPLYGIRNLCKNEIGTVSVNPNVFPTPNNFVWTWPSNWTLVSGGTGNNFITVKAPSTITSTRNSITLTATNICGTVTTTQQIITSICFGGFSISPNPANEKITISSYDDKGQLSNEMQIRAVEIIDNFGLVKYKQNYAANSKLGRLTIPVSHLKDDIYTVRIFDGINWKAYKVIIKK